MYLFLVSRTDGVGYDDYDSFVVNALDADQARDTYPGYENNWPDYVGSWVDRKDIYTMLTVEHIGQAKPGLPLGKVLVSFNAG